MTRFRVLVASLLLAALALTGCSSGAAISPPDAPAQPAPGPDPLTPAELAFIDQVATIAPPLAESPERLARRAGNSCNDIATGEPGAWPDQAISNAVERFSGGSYTVTTDEAEQILDAASTTVCAG